MWKLPVRCIKDRRTWLINLARHTDHLINIYFIESSTFPVVPFVTFSISHRSCTKEGTRNHSSLRITMTFGIDFNKLPIMVSFNFLSKTSWGISEILQIRWPRYDIFDLQVFASTYILLYYYMFFCNRLTVW